MLSGNIWSDFSGNFLSSRHDGSVVNIDFTLVKLITSKFFHRFLGICVDDSRVHLLCEVIIITNNFSSSFFQPLNEPT